MRILRIAPGEHYHIFNRAINKQTIFHNFNDYVRFLFLIIYIQSPVKVLHISRIVKDLEKYCTGQSRALATGYEEKIIKKRVVELVSFCIMPNHFHLMVKELEEGGMADYMQRVLTAYSKYYNTKYEKSGHVFQGPYRAVHVEDNEQLLHLSAYIHRNPRELSEWFRKEDKYPWSSYKDCIEKNRWGELLRPDILMGEFKDRKDYDKFVKTSKAKIFEEEFFCLDV